MKTRASLWLSLILPGDWLLLVLAAALTAASFPLLWRGGLAERVVVRSNGEIAAELDLGQDRQLTVQGPLGETRIEVHKRRVRVAADPGPRQYCVRQGWLSRAGEVALCVPNRISVEIVGRTRPYDSLNY